MLNKRDIHSDLSTLTKGVESETPLLTNIKDLNLEHEVLTQYSKLKELFRTIIDDDDTPANQKAQVANAITTLLQSLVRTQTDLYNAERLKNLEFCLIESLKNSPVEVKDAFFERYERMVGELK